MGEDAVLMDMRGVDKHFPGVQALKQAQLQVRAGTVHALMGENGAGKSTLMKCLFGIYKPDAGEILIAGRRVNFSGPKEAMEGGVSMVHQELNQVLKRNVMENLWLGRFPKRLGLVGGREMHRRTKAIFDELEIDVDPGAVIGKLSVSQRQMVEIAKAVSYHARILVLDEPTSSLTHQEVEHLFRIINKLRADGVGIVYISHRMEEILAISDDVTIMRDGAWIATEAAKDLTIDSIIKLMVGRDLTQRFPPKTNTPDGDLLVVEDLSGKYDPTCKGVSFSLRRGEILGVAGLVGSRRTELLETIFGIARRSSGSIRKDGKPIVNRDPSEAIAHGFAMITEERRANGIFGGLDITFNTVISNLNSRNRRKYREAGLLSARKMGLDTQASIDSMRIKTPSRKTRIRDLSGGNQQKVIIGRWLLTNPDVLLMDEPTRGIDVGAKAEIYQLIINLASQGKGIVMVSSEMPELLGICDRIMVMSGGRLAGILDIKEVDQEKIMRLAAKYA
ncbi:MAG: ATP-binding cassette domain-containing protein [Planctomycetota bacterium]|jgi:methyl-galactoside transport system ATP-binding protein|nr:ATP-binding cassette domain-containing protein [Planctomycetota bacterium]